MRRCAGKDAPAVCEAPVLVNVLSVLGKAVAVFPADRLWVTPDCGLKTRGYAEARATLASLVEATGS